MKSFKNKHSNTDLIKMLECLQVKQKYISKRSSGADLWSFSMKIFPKCSNHKVGIYTIVNYYGKQSMKNR